MEVVLFRHGPAEERRGNLDDEKRQLTPEGRKKTKKAAQGLAQFLKRAVHINIWSSPRVRARQTAEILARVLGVAAIKEVEALGDGDLGKFITCMKEEGFGDDDCLLVVGHEPYLSGWSEVICGHALSFKKAAATGIKVKSADLTAGELRWFAQPGVLASLGD